MTQLDDLRGVVKIALEVRRIHNHDDEIRRWQFRQTIQQHIARDLFIERVRAEAVSAGQIEHADVRLGFDAGEFAFLTLDGNARVIADLGTQAGERVEQRRLAAIWIAGQSHVSGLCTVASIVFV